MKAAIAKARYTPNATDYEVLAHLVVGEAPATTV